MAHTSQHEQSALGLTHASVESARRQDLRIASSSSHIPQQQDHGSVPLSRQSVFVPASPVPDADLELPPSTSYDAPTVTSASPRPSIGGILSALQKPLQPDQISAPKNKGPRRSRAHRPQLLWQLSEASRPRSERDLVGDYNARDFEDVPLTGMGPSAPSTSFAARILPPPPAPAPRQPREEVQIVLDEEEGPEASTSANPSRTAGSQAKTQINEEARSAETSDLRRGPRGDGDVVYEHQAAGNYTRAKDGLMTPADEFDDSHDVTLDLEAQPLQARQFQGYSAIEDKAPGYVPSFEPIVRRERAWMLLSSLMVTTLTLISIAMAVDWIGMA